MCSKKELWAHYMYMKIIEDSDYQEILMKDIISKYNGYILGVYFDNKVAIKLYKKLGFVEIKRIKKIMILQSLCS